MTNKVTGWTSVERAEREARKVSTSGKAILLADGSWAATGDVLLSSDGRQSQIVHLPRGKSMTYGEAVSAGVIVRG